MIFPGLKKDQEISDVIAYLKQFAADGKQNSPWSTPGSGFANARAVEDDPVVSRTAYVSPEAIGDAQGGIVSGLVYAGATAAAGTVLISGGAIVAALVAATLVGGAGGIVGVLLAKWLGDNHAQYLQTQVDHGGLLLWVRTRDAKAENRAVDVLKRHSSRDVHVHTLS
jgi:hypothetical protein